MKSLPLKPVKKRSIPQEIIIQITKLIDSGHLKPGSKLPPERYLAKKLNVSRPSIREALKALNLLGVIHNRHGEGSFISDYPEGWHIEKLSIMFSIKKSTLLNIFEARNVLEAGVAALAAQRRTAEDLINMKVLLKKMEKNVENHGKYIKHEVAFHKAVVDAGNNAVISDLMNKLYKLLIRAKPAFKGIISIERDYQNHVVIFEYIKKGDPDRAQKAMVDHLKYFEHQLKHKRDFQDLKIYQTNKGV